MSKRFGTTDRNDLPSRAEPADINLSLDRRAFLAGIAGTALVAALESSEAFGQGIDIPTNLAKVAHPSSFTVSSENKIAALNDGFTPVSSRDRQNGAYAIRPEFETGGPARWVQYDWSKPVTMNKIDVYWAIDVPRPNGPPGSGSMRMAAPASYNVLYWNGSDFVRVLNAQGFGMAGDTFNTTSFDEVKTARLRLEVVPDGKHEAGILEWKIYSSGPVPSLPPIVEAGIDRSVVIGGRTYLAGKAIWLQDLPGNAVRWIKDSGPGTVVFAKATLPVTTATFSAPGDYVLKLTSLDRNEQTTSTVNVHVEAAPPKERLNVVYTKKYSVDSPLWKARAKTLIVEWIPHCIRYCERTDLAADRGDGGIDNFIEAGKANRGEAHARHKGYVFSNAWVHQTMESMCIALMVDPQGDQDIIAAQKHLRVTLERWIPVILAAQMPDGYLQTAYTLADRKEWPERWSPDHRGNHEGYVSGYFLESAINHYTLTDGQDLRL